MRFREIVGEAVRPNVLYHGTTIDDAVQVVETDRLNGKTPHKAHRFGGEMRARRVDQFGEVMGVSLTRSMWFARAWKSGEGVVLGLDGDLLARRHRLYKIDYYGNRREAEEFVVGPIDNLSRYLVSITMSQETLDWCKDYDTRWIESQYGAVLNSPLLRIDGARWHPTSGKNLPTKPVGDA